MLEQLLSKDDKYKVVDFDLEYTSGRARHDQMVAIAQLCVRHHVLVHHHCLATRPCEHFARFLSSPEYMFATVGTTNDLKVLNTSGLSYQTHFNIQGQYRVWGGERNK
ncbi:hypothetical protein D1007_57382 [Hordeum vulgare]|nr:hypothetical protein D1007_57382 [Hordeum vulgare]